VEKWTVTVNGADEKDTGIINANTQSTFEIKFTLDMAEEEIEFAQVQMWQKR
jgi:hypothetical protein